MTELMTKQEIAKELLKPYFDDPSLCGVDEGGRCVYRGLEGRMCVFARACTPEGREKLVEMGTPKGLLSTLSYGILQEKYRHIEDGVFWEHLQEAHDDLAISNRRGYPIPIYQYKELTGEEYHNN